MKKFDWLQAAGLICTIGSIGLSIISSIVGNKQLDAKINEAVQAKLTDLTEK